MLKYQTAIVASDDVDKIARPTPTLVSVIIKPPNLFYEFGRSTQHVTFRVTYSKALSTWILMGFPSVSTYGNA